MTGYDRFYETGPAHFYFFSRRPPVTPSTWRAFYFSCSALLSTDRAGFWRSISVPLVNGVADTSETLMLRPTASLIAILLLQFSLRFLSRAAHRIDARQPKSSPAPGLWRTY